MRAFIKLTLVTTLPLVFSSLCAALHAAEESRPETSSVLSGTFGSDCDLGSARLASSHASTFQRPARHPIE